MAKSDKRRLREVRYTGKRACETPDRIFYDAIKGAQCNLPDKVPLVYCLLVPCLSPFSRVILVRG